jgi:hypothetical protein
MSKAEATREPRRMAARVGIEPCIGFLEACITAMRSETAETPDAQLHAHELSSLTKIISSWPKLSVELRAAVQAVTGSGTKRQP